MQFSIIKVTFCAKKSSKNCSLIAYSFTSVLIRVKKAEIMHTKAARSDIAFFHKYLLKEMAVSRPKDTACGHLTALLTSGSNEQCRCSFFLSVLILSYFRLTFNELFNHKCYFLCKAYLYTELFALLNWAAVTPHLSFPSQLASPQSGASTGAAMIHHTG